MALAWLRDLIAWFTGENFRERHDRMTEETRKRAAAEGRLYEPPGRPSIEVLGDYAHYWIHVSTKGPDGRFLVEPVHLAWPLELTDLANHRAQSRILRETLGAYQRLRERRAAAWARHGAKG